MWMGRMGRTEMRVEIPGLIRPQPFWQKAAVAVGMLMPMATKVLAGQGVLRHQVLAQLYFQVVTVLRRQRHLKVEVAVEVLELPLTEITGVFRLGVWRLLAVAPVGKRTRLQELQHPALQVAPQAVVVVVPGHPALKKTAAMGPAARLFLLTQWRQ
jgi:hypothetical protein